jgi:hypothetical protein
MRAISLSSRVPSAGFDFTDPNFQHRAYDGWQAYANRRPQTCYFLWNWIGAAKRLEFAPWRFIPGAVLPDLLRLMTNDELQHLA